MKYPVFDDNYDLFMVEEKRVKTLPSEDNSYCELSPLASSKTFMNNQIIWNYEKM